MTARSSRQQAARDAIATAARDNLPVLICGERGTGREAAAREIHSLGAHAAEPFVIGDGSSLPPTGTCYFSNLDSALLQSLAARQGARVIAASHEEVPGFHHVIHMPALRDRIEDLPWLVDSIIARIAARSQRALHVPGTLLRVLERHSWPGNLDELSRVLEAAAMESTDGALNDATVRRLLLPLTTELPSVILREMICVACEARTTTADPRRQCPMCGVPLLPIDDQLIADLADAPRFLDRRYVPYRALSRGSFSDVWLAWQVRPARRVVLKLLVAEAEPERARFEREVGVQAALRHPRIPAVYEAGTDPLLPRRHFVALEYIEGTTLLDFSDSLLGVIDEKERIRRVLCPVIETAEILDYLHARGYVHRDVKPTNILISPDERAFLIDYGLARPVGNSLTVEGTVIGTVPFMSPEQFSGLPEAIDARTDVWALGAMLYLLFTARYPFGGATFEQIADQVTLSVPEAPRTFNAAIPELLDRVILKALSKLPERRFQRGGEMAEALRAGL